VDIGMDYKKLCEMSDEELNSHKAELERQLKELSLNSALTNMEKPHQKRSLKVSVAQICGLLARGDK
jgi:ribosomal protein L29